MPKELQEAFHEVIETVQKSSEYQEYLSLEEKLKNNSQIQNLITEIKNLQKELVRGEYRQEDTKEIENIYQQKLGKLNEYPLYIAFKNQQKIVNDIIQNIKLQIEEFLDDLVQNP